jgi:valyl-tRNA synthetase
MPALSNPRYERFAQALFAGLAGETRVKRAQSTAYLAAYPNCSKGNPAEAAASRLLRRVKPIIERVRELQAEANARLQPKLDLSRERVGKRLDLASRIAEEQKNAAAIATSELGIAKVFGFIGEETNQPKQRFAQAKSMQEIGRRLLHSVGFASPDDASIQAAIEANDAFIERLEAVRDSAQGLTIDQGTD